MITVEQYFLHKQHTPEHVRRARDLLRRRELLRQEFRHATGHYTLDFDPDTGSEVSGSRGGSGDGGFRLPTATTGNAWSAHKEALAVDDYDPDNAFDNWITDAMLEKHGLWREHPSATPGWVHLQTRPASRRTYQP